jgi:hypothetical protein
MIPRHSRPGLDAPPPRAPRPLAALARLAASGGAESGDESPQSKAALPRLLFTNF